jgi:hypothetical protein
MNYYPSPTTNYYPSPTMQYMPSFLAGAGCGNGCNAYGMVTAGNVATFGAMELGRTEHSYNRAIVRTKSKIKLLRRKKRRVKLKIRKRKIARRIDRLRRKLKKLRGYKRIRAQRKAENARRKAQRKAEKADIPIPDEDFLLDEAFTSEPDIPEFELEEQMSITTASDIDYQKIALFSGLAIAGAVVVKMLLPKKTRMNIGRKSNPKRRRRRR